MREEFEEEHCKCEHFKSAFPLSMQHRKIYPYFNDWSGIDHNLYRQLDRS